MEHTTITVSPKNIWRYFQENREVLKKNIVTIAENDATGNQICVTENNSFPQILVYINNTIKYAETMISEGDAIATATRLYSQYLKTPPDEEELTRQDLEDEMYERETELYDATKDFLDVVIGNDFMAEGGSEEVIFEIMDAFLKYISDEWWFRVYRPVYMDDGDGNEIYIEYPYES